MKPKLFFLITISIFSVACYGQEVQLQWGHSFGMAGRDEASASVADRFGNVYVAGEFWQTIDFDPGPQQTSLTSSYLNDIFIAKYNSAGQLVWAVPIGGQGDGEVRDIELDKEGNVLITGRFRGTFDFDPSSSQANLTSVGGTDIYFAKYSSQGHYIWAKRIGTFAFEGGTGIGVDSLGNVYITGSFSGSVDFDPSGNTAIVSSETSAASIFVAKYNSLGNYLWAFPITSDQQQSSQDIDIDKNGDIVLTGAFSWTADFDPSSDTLFLTNNGAIDAFVAKYDPSGGLIWAFNVDGISTTNGLALEIDNSNNILITGYFSIRADFDPSPAVNLLIANGRASDAYVAKYNSSGDHLWAIGFGGRTRFSGENGGRSVATDSLGNVYVTGYFQDTADFDPSTATAYVAAAGQRDAFLAKYDANGNYMWAFPLGGESFDMGNAVVVNSLGHVIVGGFASSTIDFDPSADTVISNYGGQTDIIIASYSDFAPQPCMTISSDASWRKSSITTLTNLLGQWNGATLIPDSTTFIEPVSVGQPYGYHSIDEVANTSVIRTESDISYFKKEFYSSAQSNAEVRILTTVDDQADIYINGHRVALITAFGRSNFKYPPHDLLFGSGGLVVNGNMGGDAFDVVSQVDMDTILKTGVNEVVVAIRNLGKSSDRGGFSFRMDINCSDSLIHQKSGKIARQGDEGVNLFPNPIEDNAIINTDLAIIEVRVFDLNGKLIFESPYDAEKLVQLNLSGLQQGVYIAHIKEVGGGITLKKIVKL